MLRLICGLTLLCLFQQTDQQQQQQSVTIDPALINLIFNDIPTTTNKTDIEPKNPEVTPIPGVDNCECVAHYLCNNESVINTNGAGIIDIKADENEGPCGSYLEFCCYPPDIVPAPIPTKPLVRTGCGTRHENGVGFRITGNKDNEAQFGELPWMTAVLRGDPVKGTDVPFNVYQCGGALIHPQVVLTAAHCVSAKDKVYVIRAGEWDTQTKKEILPHQDRKVKTVIIHPKFFAPAVHNDIALLILDSPVHLAENVDVVCLPPQDYVVPAKTRCIASGWGKDKFEKDGKYQVILKRIEVPIVERNDCQNRFRTTRLGKFFQLDKSFICAGGEGGVDTCKGDGGSPLVCPIPGHPKQYQQAGIVAWGIGCGEDQIPSAYVNVAMFRNWIDEQMGQQNLDVTVYQY